MKPTLSIRLTRTDDLAICESDHGTTSSHAINSLSIETTKAAVALVMERHAADCDCKPEVIYNVWPSMAEALEIFREDAAAATGMGDGATHAAVIDTMERRACSSCDPLFSIEQTITSAGELRERVDVVHADGCRKGRREYAPYSFRILDPGLGGAA